MKIALIHSHLDGRGGSQRYVIEIAKNLKALGLDVDLFAYEYNENMCYPELTEGLDISYLYTIESCNGNKSKQEKNRLKFIFLKIYNIKLVKKTAISLGFDYIYSMVKTVSVAKDIAKMIDKKKGSQKYDLIFAHEEPLSVWAAIEYKRRTNTPIYWFCYDTIEKWFLEWREDHKKSKLRSFLLRNFYFRYDQILIRKYVDKIAVLDKNMSKRVERQYKAKPNIRRGAIPSEVLSYDRINLIREKNHIDDSKIVVFSLTRFASYRRVHDIFALYRMLPECIKEKIFIYVNAPVSDENYYQMCKKEYSELFNNQNLVIDISYFHNDAEMYDMYLSSDIFIYPNQSQTWGHAPLEAMACGCMAMVSNGCGIHEVIENITPTVYNVGEIEIMKEMFVNLIEKEKYKEYAHKQKAYISENLTWNKVCEQYVQDFNDILCHNN